MNDNKIYTARKFVLGAVFLGLLFSQPTSLLACEVVSSGQIVFASTGISNDQFGQPLHAQKGSAPDCLDYGFHISDHSATTPTGASMKLRMDRRIVNAERPRLNFWSNSNGLQGFLSGKTNGESAPLMVDVASQAVTKDLVFPVLTLKTIELRGRKVRLAQVLVPIAENAMVAIDSFAASESNKNTPLVVLDVSGSALPFIAPFMRQLNRGLADTSFLEQPTEIVFLGDDGQISDAKSLTLSDLLVADVNVPKLTSGNLSDVFATQSMTDGVAIIVGGDISLPSLDKSSSKAIVAKLTPELDHELSTSSNQWGAQFLEFSDRLGETFAQIAVESEMFSAGSNTSDGLMAELIASQKEFGFLPVAPVNLEKPINLGMRMDHKGWRAVPLWTVVSNLLFTTDTEFPVPLIAN